MDVSPSLPVSTIYSIFWVSNLDFAGLQRQDMKHTSDDTGLGVQQTHPFVHRLFSRVHSSQIW